MFRQIINKLFCLHEWELKDVINRKIEKEYINGHTDSADMIYKLFICKKCGKMKIIKYY